MTTGASLAPRGHLYLRRQHSPRMTEGKCGWFSFRAQFFTFLHTVYSLSPLKGLMMHPVLGEKQGRGAACVSSAIPSLRYDRSILSYTHCHIPLYSLSFLGPGLHE